MSEEEMNRELSADELKDVAGGYTKCATEEHMDEVKTNLVDEASRGDSFKQQQYALRNEKKKGKKDSFTLEAESD